MEPDSEEEEKKKKKKKKKGICKSVYYTHIYNTGTKEENKIYMFTEGNEL